VNNQIIDRCANATFTSRWEIDSQPVDRPLKLNFDVLIDYFQLTGSFCLLHWQARPKYLRRWGIYCSQFDQYYSCDYDKVIFPDSYQLQLLQINERTTHRVPTAVILIPDSVAFVSNRSSSPASGELIIKSLKPTE